MRGVGVVVIALLFLAPALPRAVSASVSRVEVLAAATGDVLGGQPLRDLAASTAATARSSVVTLVDESAMGGNRGGFTLSASVALPTTTSGGVLTDHVAFDVALADGSAAAAATEGAAWTPTVPPLLLNASSAGGTNGTGPTSGWTPTFAPGFGVPSSFSPFGPERIERVSPYLLGCCSNELPFDAWDVSMGLYVVRVRHFVRDATSGQVWQSGPPAVVALGIGASPHPQVAGVYIINVQEGRSVLQLRAGTPTGLAQIDLADHGGAAALTVQATVSTAVQYVEMADYVRPVTGATAERLMHNQTEYNAPFLLSGGPNVLPYDPYLSLVPGRHRLTINALGTSILAGRAITPVTIPGRSLQVSVRVDDSRGSSASAPAPVIDDAASASSSPGLDYASTVFPAICVAVFLCLALAGAAYFMHARMESVMSGLHAAQARRDELLATGSEVDEANSDDSSASSSSAASSLSSSSPF